MQERGLNGSFWAGFLIGVCTTAVIELGIFSLHSSAVGTAGKLWCNIYEGALGTPLALTFTVANVIAFSVPIAVYNTRRDYFLRCYDFCRKLPTMIGMLGTLFSLAGADLATPKDLAAKFSVAIVSTIVGIVIHLLLEFFGEGLSRRIG